MSSFRPDFTKNNANAGRQYQHLHSCDNERRPRSQDRQGGQNRRNGSYHNNASHNNGSNQDNASYNASHNMDIGGDIPVLTLSNSLSQISFCDRECYNINSDRTKAAIINYIQNKHKIRIIDRQYVTLDGNKMRNISYNEHLLSTYSNGNPYLLLLTIIDETPCCIFIDRKCKEGYNYPKMHAVQYKFARQLFERDTLFTGELIRDINREWQFLIADLLVYDGASTRDKNILTRFEMINNILDEHYVCDPTQEICPIYSKRLFQYRDLDDMFDNFMPSLSYVCKGLVFYTLNNKYSNYCWIMPRDHQIPVKRKHEYQLPNHNICHDMTMAANANLDVANDVANSIMPEAIIPHMEDTYNNSNNQSNSGSNATDTVNGVNAMTSDNNANATITNNVNSYRGSGDLEVELPRFNIIKTGTPDIYHLFTADNQVDRACVAFIPDIATSKWLYSYFRDNADRVLNTVVECKYHTEFDKWVPVAICGPDISSHNLDSLSPILAAVAGPGNSTADAIKKIKSIVNKIQNNNSNNVINDCIDTSIDSTVINAVYA